MKKMKKSQKMQNTKNIKKKKKKINKVPESLCNSPLNRHKKYLFILTLQKLPKRFVNICQKKTL